MFDISVVINLRDLCDDQRRLLPLTFCACLMLFGKVNTSDDRTLLYLTLAHISSHSRMSSAICFSYTALFFNLHLKKQYSIFHLVASWCSDSFPVALWVAPFALFLVFTLAFPSQPFPGSLLLGSAWIKNGHKKATTSKYWLGLRTAALSQHWSDRLKGCYCSARTQRPIAGF